jgi:hypothetical protein
MPACLRPCEDNPHSGKAMVPPEVSMMVPNSNPVANPQADPPSKAPSNAPSEVPLYSALQRAYSNGGTCVPKWSANRVPKCCSIRGAHCSSFRRVTPVDRTCVVRGTFRSSLRGALQSVDLGPKRGADMPSVVPSAAPAATPSQTPSMAHSTD